MEEQVRGSELKVQNRKLMEPCLAINCYRYSITCRRLRDEDSVPAASQPLTEQQGFGIFLGDDEELEGGLLGTAKALLPTADGVGTDIEIGGKEGLAGVELAADLANFSGGDGPGARGDA